MLSLRLLIVALLSGSMLTGCGLAERLDSAENRINAALPPSSAVQSSLQMLQAQVAGQDDEKKLVDRLWSGRLKLRALNCGRGYAPKFTESAAAIRVRLADSDCFAEADRSLLRWVGLQRVRLILAQGPIRPMPAELPKIISLRAPIGQMVFARDAPAAIVRHQNGFEVVDLTNGRSLFQDPGDRQTSVLSLSPNGRLFSQLASTYGKSTVIIRATEGGEALVELSDATRVLWFNKRAVGLSGTGTPSRVLDLLTAEESPVPGQRSAYMTIEAPVPGQADRFVLMSNSNVVQIDLVDVAGRYEAQLVTTRDVGAPGFAINTGGPSSDGNAWFAGHGGLRVLNLATLDYKERSFKPVDTQSSWPTTKPDEMLFTATLPNGNGVTSSSRHYVYDYRADTLARVAIDPGTRLEWIAVFKRLAIVDGQNLKLLDGLPAEAAQTASDALAPFIDEVNQRRLASLSATAAASAADAATVRASDAPYLQAQAQLRDSQLEGVGVYQGTGAGKGASSHATGFVQVHVRRSLRPITLVLSSYEPVRWTIVSDPGANIAGVLLSSYHPSSVIGAGTARVYQIGQGHAYRRESAEFAEMQRIVTRWVGKPMSVFQGRYEGSTFSVGGS